MDEEEELLLLFFAVGEDEKPLQFQKTSWQAISSL